MHWVDLGLDFMQLFECLAGQLDTFLTAYELDMGKEDKKNTIKECEQQAMAKLKEQEGLVQLPLEVWQYMVPGSGPAPRQVEIGLPKIEHRGVQILHYEQGLLNTALAEADYGESDLMDHHHTLLLKDLSDLEVYTKVTIFEQVADLVHQKCLDSFRSPFGTCCTGSSSEKEKKHCIYCENIWSWRMGAMPDS